jgi:uncharacterized membrane protein
LTSVAVMSWRRRLWLVLVALVGLGATSASSYVHYRLVTDPTYASFCDVSATVDCAPAYLSEYGSFMGVPVALHGVLFFVVVLVLVAWVARPASAAAAHAGAYVFALSIAGLAFAGYLAWASYLVLKVFCILCATTYAALVALVLLSRGATTVNATSMPRRFARDVRTLLSSPSALALVFVLVAGSAAAMILFPEGAPAPPRGQDIPALSADERTRLETWWTVQPKVELPVPAATGTKVHIVMFSDYQCPGCRAAHDALRQVLARYDRTAVEFVMKHYPLEPECNPNVPNGTHLAACEAAAAYVMARGTGFQQKLDEWLFDNQKTLTREVVAKAAADIAGIKDFDARYERALQEVKTDASLGGFVQVRSTPTVFLNGRIVAGNGKGLPPAQYVDALIDIELKKPR